jgi:hypothetical protein
MKLLKKKFILISVFFILISSHQIYAGKMNIDVLGGAGGVYTGLIGNFQANFWYAVNDDVQVGAGSGILWEWIPVIARVRYMFTKHIYAGLGFGALLIGTGDGITLEFNQGFLAPLAKSVKLDAGVTSYIKLSNGDGIIYVPRIGINFSF